MPIAESLIERILRLCSGKDVYAEWPTADTLYPRQRSGQLLTSGVLVFLV
jgi:hypothetical protein